MPATQDKYEEAFKGLLTPAELEKAAREADEFAADLRKPGKLPIWFVREVLGRLPDGMKEKIVESGVKKADAAGHDYSDIAARLNGHQFRLENRYGNVVLSRLKSPQDLSRLFRPGDEFQWPTIVLTANSNLASPQSFFDSMEAAQRVVPCITRTNSHNTVVAGTYFSQRNVNANALDAIRRYRELGIHPESLQGMSPAAELQAYQMIDLLLERDAQGRVQLHEVIDENTGKIQSRPILRMDAGDVLSHIICYGYSAAHMVNKDAFRALQDMLLKGDVLVQIPSHPEPRIAKASHRYVHDLLNRARIIGLAGMDRMEKIADSRMPHEVNFIHRGDLSNALKGPQQLAAQNVIIIKSPDGDDTRLEERHGGHGQQAYVEALLSNRNKSVRDRARVLLSGRGAKL